jgi:hypothetical protein
MTLTAATDKWFHTGWRLPAAVLAELAVHGERSFNDVQSKAGKRADNVS